MKMIFFNIGNMEHYRGMENDSISSDAGFIKNNGYGLEMFNFDPLNGMMYGYVQNGENRININRLGAKTKDSYINDITVVWIAKAPKGGTCIVGWYRDATVFRSKQYLTGANRHQYKGEEIGFRVSAKAKNCKCLPIDERVFIIPRGKNGIGRSCIWYADKEANYDLKKKVAELIIKGTFPKSSHKSNRINMERKKEVEEKAIQIATDYYNHFGYLIESVEEENLGWDLNAFHDTQDLKIEVKGLSGSEINCFLTPKEYETMKNHKNEYRIFVVSKALSEKPENTIIHYSDKKKSWVDDKGDSIKFIEKVAAQISF